MKITAIVVPAAKPNFYAIQDTGSGRFMLTPAGKPIVTRKRDRAAELAASWMKGSSAEVLDQDRRAGIVSDASVAEPVAEQVA